MIFTSVNVVGSWRPRQFSAETMEDQICVKYLVSQSTPTPHRLGEFCLQVDIRMISQLFPGQPY